MKTIELPAQRVPVIDKADVVGGGKIGMKPRIDHAKRRSDDLLKQSAS